MRADLLTRLREVGEIGDGGLVHVAGSKMLILLEYFNRNRALPLVVIDSPVIDSEKKLPRVLGEKLL